MDLPVFDLEPYLKAIVTSLQSNELTALDDIPTTVQDIPDDKKQQSSCSDLIKEEEEEEEEEKEELPALPDSLDGDLLLSLCKGVADCIRRTGSLVIRDPRCPSSDNDRFINMMERYFECSEEFKLEQARPDLHYQVGVTPECTEVPRSAVDPDVQAAIKKQPEEDRARMPTGPDLKSRYMWRVGPRPAATKFKELNAAPVIPPGFPEWCEVMDTWGAMMIRALETVAEMLAIGFGLPRDAFTSLMHEGPHLLAPTGSNLGKHGEIGAVFAGYHYDLNFLTIHGRSRFPGLAIWTRDGRRVPVSVPTGCLLVQAGKQLEWLTGGVCTAGMHEVIVDERTVKSIAAAKEANRSLWRVSSTLFSHVASDAILRPLGHFAESETASKYPATHAGNYVVAELAAINLKKRR